ncbi:MAG: peptide antibiotic transporter SbmA [Pseudomonadota bacterium]
MFRSFFPNPKVFFLSALGWTALSFLVWFTVGDALGELINIGAGLNLESGEGGRRPFFTPEKVWTYQFIIMTGATFCVLWAFLGRDQWYWWSVVGSTGLVLSTYASVQISVFLNTWYGNFYDLIQRALTKPETVTLADYYDQLLTAMYVLVPYITFLVALDFFTSHYLFRWRKAMNDYYMSFWPILRNVEGASQRIQEDTQKFAAIMETLGLSFVRSVMTLIAFLPLLWTLSEKVTEYPVLGDVSQGLVYLAILSAALGTVVLAAVGFKLPGLEFENQKVEAAYRKELVYGEDDHGRADPPTATQLFDNLREFYFRYFFHYLYFNVARYAYLQGATFIPFIALGPTIVTGVITFGVFQQILNAFNQVENAFQFLANSWTRIVELMSVHKRLRAFEQNIYAGEAVIA